MDTSEKVRENRLRQMAGRQGLSLSKSRRRDPRALDFGAWHVVTRRTAGWRGAELVSPEQGMTLDEIEAFLTSDTPDVDEDGIVNETVADVAAARQTRRDYLAARDDTTHVRTYADDNGDVLDTAEAVVIDADFDAHPALPEAMESDAYDDALQRLRTRLAGRP